MDTVTEEGAGVTHEQARPSFFSIDGDRFVPSAPSRSPWNRDHQNGVAIAGLLTHLSEQVEAPCRMLAAHMTIEILRPTPFKPVQARACVVRDGRRRQIVEAVLMSEGAVTARARVLRLRTAPSPDFHEPPAHPPPEQSPPRSMLSRDSIIGDLVETRSVRGGFDEPGPAVMWARFRADIVPGVPAAGLAQTAMLADFGNGLSCSLDRDRWTYANVDISVHQVRNPVGSWVLLASETMVQGQGVGLVNTVLADRNGPYGRAHQTLFIDSWPG